MNQKVNAKYAELFTNNKARYFIFMGGRGAGRSFVGSQYSVSKLVSPDYFRAAIMRLVLGDIRNSIYQDIYDRLEENGVLEDPNLKISEHNLRFEYGNNSIRGIGFRKSSGDQKSKLKSLAAFNCIEIEEADEVAEEDFMQLDDSIRSVKGDIKVILQLNPPDKNHWIIKRFFNLVPSGVEGFYTPVLKESVKKNTVFVHSSYRDNLANISEVTQENYENYRETNPDHYWNMIRGLVSEGKRGRIFKNWKPTTNYVYDNDLPYREILGLDFGFTNDPTALIGVKTHNKRAWLREYIYETGLTMPRLSERMEQLGIKKSTLIYADSAEPASIQQLRDLGWNVVAATKGQGSVNAGIDMLVESEVYYTEESTDIAIESQEYKWALDRNKEPTNDPIDDHNHAMDAIRYAVYSEKTKPFVGVL